ncbi:MAG: hypothetical protein V7K90_19830 [Nostoc sp.]|uniref:hypothetical protein n=1 Tax=Nostoc sp. TaxID=1180 RepID=UPI002FF51F25
MKKGKAIAVWVFPDRVGARSEDILTLEDFGNGLVLKLAWRGSRKNLEIFINHC